jgi:hypothetical protein
MASTGQDLRMLHIRINRARCFFPPTFHVSLILPILPEQMQFDVGLCYWLWVYKASFTSMSVISWRSVLLVEKPDNLEKNTDLSQVPNFYTLNSIETHFTMTLHGTHNACGKIPPFLHLYM